MTILAYIAAIYVAWRCIAYFVRAYHRGPVADPLEEVVKSLSSDEKAP